MVCPKCKSDNVSVQVVMDSKLVNKHHGLAWYLCFGWLFSAIRWCVLFVPSLLAKIFLPKKQKLKQTERRVCVCQSCGYSWNK